MFIPPKYGMLIPPHVTMCGKMFRHFQSWNWSVHDNQQEPWQLSTSPKGVVSNVIILCLQEASPMPPRMQKPGNQEAKFRCAIHLPCHHTSNYLLRTWLCSTVLKIVVRFASILYNYSIVTSAVHRSTWLMGLLPCFLDHQVESCPKSDNALARPLNRIVFPTRKADAIVQQWGYTGTPVLYRQKLLSQWGSVMIIHWNLVKHPSGTADNALRLRQSHWLIYYDILDFWCP